MCDVQVHHSRKSAAKQLSRGRQAGFCAYPASLPPANLKARTLQATLKPGTSVKRVASPVSKWIESKHTGQSAWTFHDTELYEHEVNPLQRFLVDSSISGGKLLAALLHDRVRLCLYQVPGSAFH